MLKPSLIFHFSTMTQEKKNSELNKTYNTYELSKK